MFHEIVCINQFDSFNKLHVIQGIVSQIKLKIQQNTVTTNMLNEFNKVNFFPQYQKIYLKMIG